MCIRDSINGERVGELMEDGTTVYDELKPGYTDMGLRVQYQSYDVTHLLNSDGLKMCIIDSIFT